MQESPRESAVEERDVLDKATLGQSHLYQAGVEEQVRSEPCCFMIFPCQYLKFPESSMRFDIKDYEFYF